MATPTDRSSLKNTIIKLLDSNNFDYGSFNSMSKHFDILQESVIELIDSKQQQSEKQSVVHMLLRNMNQQIENDYWRANEEKEGGYLLGRLINKYQDLDWKTVFAPHRRYEQFIFEQFYIHTGVYVPNKLKYTQSILYLATFLNEILEQSSMDSNNTIKDDFKHIDFTSEQTKNNILNASYLVWPYIKSDYSAPARGVNTRLALTCGLLYKDLKPIWNKQDLTGQAGLLYNEILHHQILAGLNEKSVYNAFDMSPKEEHKRMYPEHIDAVDPFASLDKYLQKRFKHILSAEQVKYIVTNMLLSDTTIIDTTKSKQLLIEAMAASNVMNALDTPMF